MIINAKSNIVITGSNKGLGLELALNLLCRGHNVYSLGRSDFDIKSISDIDTSNWDYYKCDISNIDSVKEYIKYLNSKVKSIDILINNASILGSISNIENYDPLVWKRVIDINLNGTFNITHFLTSLIKRSNNAYILNISSSVGLKPRANWGAYSISKYAIEGFTSILKQEFKGLNINISSLNPGAMRTKMRAEAYPNEDINLLAEPSYIADNIINKVFYKNK